jgi:predicted enzyme related to lactoylglutathione lyase
MGPGVYTSFQLDGKAVAAGYGLLSQQAEHGVAPYWMSYISTDSVDISVNQAEAIGGKLLMSAIDVPQANKGTHSCPSTSKSPMFTKHRALQ